MLNNVDKKHLEIMNMIGKAMAVTLITTLGILLFFLIIMYVKLFKMGDFCF